MRSDFNKHKIKIGDKFGYWEVTEGPFSKNNKAAVVCKCKCGAIKEFMLFRLTCDEGSTSCGCRHKEIMSNLLRKGSLEENGYKKCATCLEIKEIFDFSKCQKTKDTFQSNCRKCINKKFLRNRYNITPEIYEEILSIQGYQCPICMRHISQLTNTDNFVIDHNHNLNCKHIRGLLCNSCNKALGIYKDDITILQNAINYLKQENIMIIVNEKLKFVNKKAV